MGVISPAKIESVLYVHTCSGSCTYPHDVNLVCVQKKPLAPCPHGGARRNSSCFDPDFPPHGADFLRCLGRLRICQRSRSFQLDHWQHRTSHRLPWWQKPCEFWNPNRTHPDTSKQSLPKKIDAGSSEIRIKSHDVFPGTPAFHH